jgi:hypothetical protein
VGGAQALALHAAVSELVLKRDQKSSEKKGFAPEIEKKRNCKKWIFQKKKKWILDFFFERKSEKTKRKAKRKNQRT